MKNRNLLPLGSVVYLKDGTKKVLIIARGLIAKRGDGVVYFDYGGVPYPEGLQDDKMAYFQHDAIVKVVFEGFTDADDEVTIEKICTFVDNHPEIAIGDVNQLIEND